ncbi:hypothetical protein GGI00_002729 [Coemansia sp. RSA 2681]|nr:hypothetical protein GGI00_002729 [Coemansia sp. RSA 2681]
MLYISDTDDNPSSRRHVAWSHFCSPAPINFATADSPGSSSSQGSSVLKLMMRGGDSPIATLSSASSEWPSMLHIASTYSASRAVLSPIDDVDESSRIEEEREEATNHRSQQLFAEAVFARRKPAAAAATQQRSRVGPMDVDYNDTDSSWLNAPAQEQSKDDSEHTRKTNERTDNAAPVLGNTPFTFRMAEPEPMLVDSEPPSATRPAVRSGDGNPISPNAIRKIYSRRRNQQHKQQKQQHTRNPRQMSGMGGEAAASSAWTTDNESLSESSSVVSESIASPPASQRRRQRQRQNRIQRSNSAVTRGVDRVLALMGSRVDEPTVVERLQMHRDIPYVISGYLQLGFNIFMVGTVLLIIVHVLLTIQRDVNSKVQEYSTEIMQEIAACSKQYRDNRCELALRVPAMEEACNLWDSCMHRDPTMVGRAKVSAETLAEIINGFIDPISLKTMLFFVLMFFGTLFFSNFAFGAYRHSRVRQQYVSQSGDRHHHHLPLPPPPSNLRVRRHQAHGDYLASPTPRPPSQHSHHYHSASTGVGGGGFPLLGASSRTGRSRSGSSASSRHQRMAPSADLLRRK